MPWRRSIDGLKLVGLWHFDEKEIRHLIKKLGKKHRYAQVVCGQLTGLLDTGRIHHSAIWRFSKWCDTIYTASATAQVIANKLFYGHVCPRLLDTHGRPMPNMKAAKHTYQKWLKLVTSKDALTRSKRRLDEHK